MPEEFNQQIVNAKLSCSVQGSKAWTPLNTSSVLLFSGDALFIASPEGKNLLMKVELPHEEDVRWRNPLTPRLIVSPNEQFCAIVNDYGRYGILVDLQKRQIVISLDRGDYHPETTPFPAAFALHQGKCVLIHGTDWNRVDVSDPASGQLLTERPSPPCQQNEELPEHYLDYFHGRLHLSPNGEWIIDDGWLWHPVGIPSIWSLQEWLIKNVWEAEDGPSRKELCWRTYHWDVAMAFIDNNRVAISGLGDDDEEMQPGARVFDVQAGEEIHAFAGPSGLFFSDGEHLLSSEPDGLHFWDVHQGVCIQRLEDFRPQFQIPSALVQIEDDLLSYWPLPAEN